MVGERNTMLSFSKPNSYEYIHYTNGSIDYLDLTRIYSQAAEKLALHTPNGLWVSVTGINDWEQYCLKNNYRLENLKSEFQVFLKPTANILILYNRSIFNDFLEEYGYYANGKETLSGNYTFNLSISWERIMEDYEGLWHKTWNCTSGCIWDLKAVEKIDCSYSPI